MSETDALLAAINGQLGQTQATSPDGMPLLQDPRFLRYERVKSYSMNETERST